jgi:hypothetical protein
MDFFTTKTQKISYISVSQLTIPYQNKCSRLHRYHCVSTGSEGNKPPASEYPGIKWQGNENDHSPAASTEVKNVWKRTSTPSYVFTARCFINHCGNSIFSYRYKISPLYIVLSIPPFLESLKLNYLQQFRTVVTWDWIWWIQNWHQSSQAACGTSSPSSCHHDDIPTEHRKRCVYITVLLYMEHSTCHGHTNAHSTLTLRQDDSYSDATLQINILHGFSWNYCGATVCQK